jgi:hypothetical protein
MTPTRAGDYTDDELRRLLDSALDGDNDIDAERGRDATGASPVSESMPAATDARPRTLADARAILGAMQREGRLQVLDGADYRGCTQETRTIEELLADDSDSALTPQIEKLLTSQKGTSAHDHKGTSDCDRENAVNPCPSTASHHLSASQSDQDFSALIPSPNSDPTSPPEPTDSPIANPKTRLPRIRTRWRAVPVPGKLALWEQAILEGAGGFAFTLNASHDVCDQARHDPKGPADFMRRRISRHLRHTLGHVPDFWILVEASPGRHFHLHGAIEAAGKHTIEGALKGAAGEVPDNFKNRVLRAERLKPGWTAYSVKSMTRNYRELAGKLIACTRPLNARAQKLYGDQRAAFLEAR